MTIFGVDLSSHNSGIDLNQVKNEGVKFAILRAGYTGYGNGISKNKDNSFELFYNECKRLGIGVGAYWFSCANTYDKGVSEANWMYENCLKGKQFEYPIYLDVEEDGGNRHYLSGSGKAGVTSGIKGFCETLEKLGYYVGVYANSDWFNRLIDSSIPTRYDCWLANWNTTNPATPSHGMWQFGGETNKVRSNRIAGQVVDQDYAYKDYPTIMKSKGLNGYGKTTPIKKSNEEIANEVINGNWGNGDGRKKRLASAGYDYQTIQNIVNQKLGATSKPTKRYHTVVKGDTLFGIAKKYYGNGNRYPEIAKANNIKNANFIQVGQRLLIP